MENGVVLGLAAIGGISAFYSLAVVAPLILGAIGGAFSCGILGVVIGLVFVSESVALVTLGCAVLGLFGGPVAALEKSLTVPDSEFVDDFAHAQWAQLSRMCSGITLLVAGLIGAYLSGTNVAADSLDVIAGYGAGSIVGSIGWYFSGSTLVYQLLHTLVHAQAR